MSILYRNWTTGDDTLGDGSFGNPFKTLQRTFNSATRGDRLRLDNIALEPLSAPIDLTLGYNNAGQGYLTIEPYDAGGSLEIQRPDEVAGGRLATSVELTGNFQLFSQQYEAFALNEISINNGGFQLTTSNNWVLSGCEFNKDATYDGSCIQPNGNNALFKNVFFNNIITPRPVIALAGNQMVIDNCYFKNIASGGAFGDPHSFIEVPFLTGTVIKRNIFNIVTPGDNAVRYTDGYTGILEGNTFISNGGNDQTGIIIPGKDLFGTFVSFQELYNNIFYNFTGSTSYGIEFTNAANVYLKTFGWNGFFDAPVSGSIPSAVIDGTSLNVIGTGSPFVNEAGFDFTPSAASGLRGAGLGNPNSFIDIGAVQSKSEVIIPSTDQNQYRANRSCE